MASTEAGGRLGDGILMREGYTIDGTTAYVVGASRSGRLLRQFRVDGLNVDEESRRVSVLTWPLIAGAGLGPFNERLAIPGYSSSPATR